MKKSIVESVTRRVKGEARKKVQAYKAEIDKDGKEILDETPLFLEVGQKPRETLDQKIRRVTQEVQADTVAKLKAQQMTEEEVKMVLDEENNFNIPSDLEDVLTPYEAAGIITDLEEQVILEQPVTVDTTQEPAPVDEVIADETNTAETTTETAI